MLLFQSTIEAGISERVPAKCHLHGDENLYGTTLMDIPTPKFVVFDECITEGILADFLKQNKSEAIAMSIFEYDQEAHMKLVWQEGYDEGKTAGIVELVRDGILPLAEALKRINMSEEEFKKLL